MGINKLIYPPQQHFGVIKNVPLDEQEPDLAFQEKKDELQAMINDDKTKFFATGGKIEIISNGTTGNRHSFNGTKKHLSKKEFLQIRKTQEYNKRAIKNKLKALREK